METKRLVIDVHKNLHTIIKLKATTRNISIRIWVLRAILEAIRKEESYNK